MKFLAYFIAIFIAFGVAWNKGVTKDGLVSYYDRHPKDGNGAVVLYYLGKWHEVAGNHDKMHVIYGKIVERYPKSPQALDSHFGYALALEKMNRYPEAIAEYEKFLEKYPNSKYTRSVRNNIEILKSR